MPYHPIPTDRLEGLLAGERDLSSAEAAARRERFGANDIVEAPPGTWRDLVRDTARDPMIWFLVGVSALFAAVGEWTEAVIMLAALGPLAGMDAYLHRRTQASTRGLADRLAATVEASRDGTPVVLPARDLVPGDLVRVGAGQFFPADGLIVVGEALQADESSLTGEAYPARKRPFVPEPRTPGAADMEQWGFAGTRLLTGAAQLRVTHTGAETLYGGIVRSALAGSHARTPLQIAVGGLVTIMLVAASILCIALALIRLLQGHGPLDAALSAITLAVAAIPEEFPVVFTFYLGVGVHRLARRRALVRRAVAVENVGRVTCICSDKTGTLTEGALVLAHQQPAGGIAPDGLAPIAALAARAESGDPLDVALIDAARPAAAAVRLAAFPFTEDRRRETAVLRMADGACVAIVKGAPETVLALCAEDAAALGGWRAQIELLASSGHKVIACATRPLDETSWAGGEPDRGYRFAGLLAFEDRVRPGVRKAVAACQEAGIRVVMVTGDHPVTAAAIAREVGLGGERPVVVTAESMEATSDDARAGLLEGVDAIARAAPAQKLDLVRALQRAGEIVAVTGDGVNDVPALQAADVGIAMGERGTRSACEVAAIVLTDDNFRTIVRAIAEGRQLFRNLQLSFAFLMVVHIPLVLSAALIPLAGFPLLYLPIHIVWLELVIHPTAMLVFQELPSSDRLMRMPRERAPRFFGKAALLAIGGVGGLITAVVIVNYHHALGLGLAVDHARAMALATLVVAGAVVTAVLSGLRTRSARLVVLASLASLAAFTQVPALARVFHLSPLHATDWLLAIGGGACAGLAALVVPALLRRGS